MKSVAVVMTYLGNLSGSGYFDLYLRSCEKNASIDFFIFTDDDKRYTDAPNIHILPMTLDGFRARAKRALGFEPTVDTPYKLCDYKPVYGDIYRDELKGYDFWGYNDCDLIFGDIRRFLTDDILDKYDKLLTMGHLTLIRNSEEMITAYKRALKGYNTDYRTAFTTNDVIAFDEWGRDGGMNRIFRQAGYALYDAFPFDDISYYRTGFRPEQKRLNPPFYEMRKNAYSYENGRLFRVSDSFGDLLKQEVLYVHFQKRKMEHKVEGTPDSFIMYPNCFDAFKTIDMDFFSAMQPDRADYKAQMERRVNRLKLRLKSVLNGRGKA